MKTSHLSLAAGLCAAAIAAGLSWTPLSLAGKPAASAVEQQTSEVASILDRIEKALAVIEKAVAGNQANYAQLRELDRLLTQLALVEREAATTLAAQPTLRKRVAGLKTRVEAARKMHQEAVAAERKRRGETGAPSATEESLMTLSAGSGIGSSKSNKPKVGGVKAMGPMISYGGAAMPAPASRPMPQGAMTSRAVVPEPVPPAIRPPVKPPSDWNREAYDHLEENPFLAVADAPISTFSIDVDTASYSNLRRMLNAGSKEIPKGAIRIEELVNYFKYSYPKPDATHPLRADVEVTGCPWAADHRLARVALQSKIIGVDERKPNNLVFLVDSSGSMRNADKIGLLKDAYKLLIDNLDDRDRVAIVTYAGSAGLVLPSTTANNRLTLKFALEQLQAGGSTAGGAGIKLAYKTARENFIKDGNNRVILATDGDFNVGVSSQSELVDVIKEEAKSGVFLTVLGFGRSNYQDARMEALSNHGNGNYAYLDGMAEARKVFLTDLMGTLYTVAKDVKLQIEFNPAFVQGYRLIGYENRKLADRDFADDKKDAGEVGSGHQVTALYELVPVGAGADVPSAGPLKYQGARLQADIRELMNVKLRYKQPDGDTSTELATPVPLPGAWKDGPDFAKASPGTRFASAVVGFGMILRGSEHKGSADFDWVHKTALGALEQDPGGFRSGFVELVGKARDLKATPPPPPPGSRPDPMPPPKPVRF